VGGQEDMIVDVALELLKRKQHEPSRFVPAMSEVG